MGQTVREVCPWTTLHSYICLKKKCRRGIFSHITLIRLWVISLTGRMLASTADISLRRKRNQRKWEFLEEQRILWLNDGRILEASLRGRPVFAHQKPCPCLTTLLGEFLHPPRESSPACTNRVIWPSNTVLITSWVCVSGGRFFRNSIPNLGLQIAITLSHITLYFLLLLRVAINFTMNKLHSRHSAKYFICFTLYTLHPNSIK